MMFKMILIASFLWSGSAFGQELVDRTYTESSTATDAAPARKEIQDKATLMATEDIARELLGDERFQRSRDQIRGRIIKSATRYIPVIKPGAMTRGSDGVAKMPVTLRVNVASLRQILQDAGLINVNNGSPLILPVVAIDDDVSKQEDRWWLTSEAGDAPQARALNREFEAALKKSFRHSGFHLVTPRTSSLSASVPKAFRRSNHSAEDLRWMADWFGAPLVLQGSVQVVPGSEKRPRIEVKLSVNQVSNNRSIADVVRSFPVEGRGGEAAVLNSWKLVLDGLGKDLSNQVEDAWQKGSIGSSQLKLAIEPRPSLPSLDGLKTKLKTSNVGIRDIRERQLNSGSVIFEVDSASSASDLASKLNGFEFEGRSLEARAESNGEVRARWGGGRGTP